jgi:hypothetical protein
MMNCSKTIIVFSNILSEPARIKYTSSFSFHFAKNRKNVWTIQNIFFVNCYREVAKKTRGNVTAFRMG